MSVMNRVYTFDLPVDDMGRARKFYEEVFGWVIAPVLESGGNYHSAITVPSDEKGGSYQNLEHTMLWDGDIRALSLFLHMILSLLSQLRLLILQYKLKAS